MTGRVQRRSAPDPATEATCRHCFESIRKRRDKSGNGFEWVAYLGWDYRLKHHVYSRFCYEPGTAKRIRPVTQHAPIPLDSPVKLERWLNRP